MLYGVNGEGMGHATRSQVVVDALLARHDVRVVASGAAFRYLRDRLPKVKEIFGPTLALGEGQIERWQTVLHWAGASCPRPSGSGWPRCTTGAPTSSSLTSSRCRRASRG